MNKEMMTKLAETAIREFCVKYAEQGYVINTPNVIIEKLPSGTAGLAYIRENLIKLDEDYFRENQDKIIFDTIPHEIAHFIVHTYYKNAKQNHGPEFRSVMRSIGLSGSTYHTMERPAGREKNNVKRYELACNCAFYFVTKAKYEKYTTKPYICKTCGSRFKHTGLVVTTNDLAALKKASA